MSNGARKVDTFIACTHVKQAIRFRLQNTYRRQGSTIRTKTNNKIEDENVRQNKWRSEHIAIAITTATIKCWQEKRD